ncbi:MAG: NAD-dependent dihydropyrimidine dehydrogenase subunit PreA [Candidatus Sumerlaeaceae bacterium]|nr:NAD-dependent dihydropyrimidine dehydrogenase subunit PreA [Candidatus Sumerlaeaceae bacterium]
MTIRKPDISSNICGIKSPNPFWLASAPPTNSGYQVRRAFEAGWGGAVWKTLTHEPIVNVSSRYGAVDYDGRKVLGLNNIELITDRTLDVNLKEVREVKKDFPNHAVIVSLMVDSKREVWHDIVKKVEDTGCDGLELNFGCPHGMSERGMGSAVGQVPEYTEMVTSWVKEVAKTPVLVKLTPNITDVRHVGRAAKRGGADGISLINTINSIMGVDLNTLAPRPQVAGRGSHGGYCGPAVKPIALNMVQSIAADKEIQLPISGIGGIQAWQDAVEFLLLGATTVQVCTAVMHYGYRIVETMISGLENWMREKGYAKISDFQGATVAKVGDWADLDLSYKVVAEIDQNKCIHCGLCYIACEDGAHQSIRMTTITEEEFAKRNGNGGPASVEFSGGKRVISGSGDGRVNIFEIKQDTCVGCNMCSLVCPVSNCITMVERESGLPKMSWRQYTEKLAKGEVEKIQPPVHV